MRTSEKSWQPKLGHNSEYSDSITTGLGIERQIGFFMNLEVKSLPFFIYAYFDFTDDITDHFVLWGHSQPKHHGDCIIAHKEMNTYIWKTEKCKAKHHTICQTKSWYT